MSYLETFSEEQQTLLVALPYRVGLWISQSDDDGGEESDQLEMQALEALLAGYSEDCCKSELVDELLRATMGAKAQWPTWQDNLDAVTTECEQALAVLKDSVPEPLVVSFKAALMDIALAVATAYCEQEPEAAFSGKVALYMRYYKERFSALLEKRPPLSIEQIISISQSEQDALSRLADILDLDISNVA